MENMRERDNSGNGTVRRTVALVALGATLGLAAIMIAAGPRFDALTSEGATAHAAYEPPPPRPSPGVINEGGCDDGHLPMTHTNVWSAADVRNEKYLGKLVCAGAYSRDPSIGVFLSITYKGPPYDSSGHLTWMYGSGPFRITEAPLGDEGSAHVRDAHIQFKSELGVVGYVDLADDSLHITGGPVDGVCPSGTTGTPPDCDIDWAELEPLKVTPRSQVVRAGKKAVFTATIKNSGRAAARAVRICVTAPKKFIATKWCHPVGGLAVGRTATRKFRVKVRRKTDPGEVTLRFETTSDVGEKHAKATIEVK